MDTLQMLLSMEPVAAVQEKEVAIKRLSTEEGQMIFTLRSLSWNRCAELRKIGGDDMKLHIILAGTKAPDLKNQALLDRWGAETPLALLKKMLIAGEIDDLSLEIEKLSGYKTDTLEDVKKK